MLGDGESGENGLIEGAVGAVGLLIVETVFQSAFGGAFEAGEEFEQSGFSRPVFAGDDQTFSLQKFDI